MDWQPPADYKPSPAVYIVPAITCLVSTVATALIAVATKTDTVSEGIVLGLVVGVGLAGASVMVTGFVDPTKAQPVTNALISGAYQVVGPLVCRGDEQDDTGHEQERTHAKHCPARARVMDDVGKVGLLGFCGSE